MRPTLDLSVARLPLPLPAAQLAADDELADRWLGALGEAASASRDLVRQGVVPPHAFAGNTIFLAFSHYDLTGGIYTREQVTYRRPVRLGETLSVEGEIAATYLRRGRRFRITTSQTCDEGSDIVVESRSTGVERFQPRSEAVGTDEEPPPVAAPQPFYDAAAGNPCRRAIRSLAPGDEITALATTITLPMLRSAAGREDRNPIHTDPEVARRAGLDAPIAGGTHVLAFVAEALMAELGRELLLHGAHIDVRWIRPVEVGEAVRPRAVVQTWDERAVTFTLEATCGGEPAMVGRAIIPV